MDAACNGGGLGDAGSDGTVTPLQQDRWRFHARHPLVPEPMPHPNYAVVVGEMAVLPLVFGQPGFAALNAAVIVIRVKAETAALSANAGR